MALAGKVAGALVGGALLTGCVAMETDFAPPAAPTPAPAPPALQERVFPVGYRAPMAGVVPAPSEESLALVGYYGRLQNDLLVRGLLRQDGGGIDTPYDARTLADNFRQIAFYDEYSSRGGQITTGGPQTALRRWVDPVRVSVTFGASVSPAQQRSDYRTIELYVARLARVTGHPISMSQAGNFNVLILNEEERRAFSPQIPRLAPYAGVAAARMVADLPRSDLCIVLASAKPSNPNAYGQAIAVVRAEHPDLLRVSCLHEEIAQGLGLPNDSPYARPSIFNDDEEFALLTSHDEALLSMLYDPRLRPGMSASAAQPIISQIASELAP